MLIKKMVIGIIVLAAIISLIWICYSYFHTPKQIYDGILVYKEGYQYIINC